MTRFLPLLCAMLSLTACGTSGFDEMRAASRARVASAPSAQRPIVRPRPAAQPAQQTPEAPRGVITASALPAASATTTKPLSARLVRAGGGTVQVRPGETLFAVSRRSGVAVPDLASANKLSPPYALVAGTSLVVPAVRYYLVEPGETAAAIARQTGVPLTQITSLNNLDSTRTVRQGQRLRLPLDRILPPTADERSAAEQKIARAPEPATVAAPTRPAATPAPADAPSGAVPAEAQAAATDRPAPDKSASPRPVFAWPLQGRILSGFGAKPNGQFNDGINIAARTGQAVYAAADGEVVYADARLRGFGNLLLVRHAGGWLTAYAHAESLLVRKGDVVKRGEVIARAGATGAVRTPQLHFEMRFNRKAINPLPLLPERSLVLSQGSEAPDPRL